MDFVPILMIGAVMYFLIIRPQMQEKNAHEAFLDSLARDMRIITSAGIHGRVVSVDAATVVIEIAEKTRIVIEKSSVARSQDEPARAA